MSGGIPFPGSACCDLKKCPCVNELVSIMPPAIKTMAATGTSHADRPDQTLPFTTEPFARRFSNLRLQPAGTSSMLSSPYNWTTFRVPASTHTQRAHVLKCSSIDDHSPASTPPSTQFEI